MTHVDFSGWWLRAASKAAKEEATKEMTMDAGQQGLDLSTSSGG
tara:strand:+ start:88 stop:219 length:132 start_codon:yes stop_codon:yes gene_type:complete